MEITKGIEIVDLGLFIKKPKILVLSDFHIGYEESLNIRGILIPRTQFKETVKRLEIILEKTKPKIIVITGDLKHEFGANLGTEWKQVLRLIEFMSKKSKVILLKGNHDAVLGYILKKSNLKLQDYFKIKDAIILHGDNIPKHSDFKRSKMVLIGHEHPAVGLRDKAKIEYFKCFLKGKFKGKDLIVLPSFNLLLAGTNILGQKLLSPFLKHNIENFKVFVVEENKVYDFGKIKKLR